MRRKMRDKKYTTSGKKSVFRRKEALGIQNRELSPIDRAVITRKSRAEAPFISLGMDGIIDLF